MKSPCYTDAVSLKMLLERIRQAIAKKPTEANRLAGARMLRQYFIKNQHRHAAEIATLAGAEPANRQHTAADDERSGCDTGIDISELATTDQMANSRS
ncbi:MAG: hypothetical protein U5P41_10485 [Gammaproteobacteria bacterium]|nr:hypothetical protein [Gammaproteobacteria bacterium]